MAVEISHDHPHISSLFADFPHDRIWLEAALRSEDRRFFADDAEHPHAMLVWHRLGACFLAARSVDAVGPFLDELMCLEAPPDFSYISLPDNGWAAAIHERFGNRFTPLQRVSFSFDPALWARQKAALPPVPAEFTLRQIDDALAARVAAEIDAGFGAAWPDPARFTAESIGFCLLEGDRFAAVAYSAFPPNFGIEFSVVTATQHRGRGLIALACAPLIDHCLAHGLEPHWSTHAVNLPSQRAAAKVGFACEERHFWVHHAPWNAGRQSVPASPEVLARVAGEYSRENGLHIFFSTEDGVLTARFGSPQASRVTFHAESERAFFLDENNAQLLVPEDDTDTLMLLINGKEHPLTRAAVE